MMEDNKDKDSNVYASQIKSHSMQQSKAKKRKLPDLSDEQSIDVLPGSKDGSTETQTTGRGRGRKKTPHKLPAKEKQPEFSRSSSGSILPYGTTLSTNKSPLPYGQPYVPKKTLKRPKLLSAPESTSSTPPGLGLSSQAFTSQDASECLHPNQDADNINHVLVPPGKNGRINGSKNCGRSKNRTKNHVEPRVDPELQQQESSIGNIDMKSTDNIKRKRKGRCPSKGGTPRGDKTSQGCSVQSAMPITPLFTASEKTMSSEQSAQSPASSPDQLLYPIPKSSCVCGSEQDRTLTTLKNCRDKLSSEATGLSPTTDILDACETSPTGHSILDVCEAFTHQPIPSNIREDFDGNLDKDACDDSDEDLPSLPRPSQGSKGYPEKQDLVWVKFKQFPHWPALVKSLIYKKKKRLHKIVVIFIGEMYEGDRARGLSLTYRPDAVIHFGRSTEEHQKLKEQGLASCYREYFKEAVERAEEFVWKRGKGGLDCDAFHFFKDDVTKDLWTDEAKIEDGDLEMEDVGSEMTEENDAAADEDETEEEAVNEESRLEDGINNETNISPKALKIRRERKRDSNKPLIDFIRSDTMKKHLIALKEGKHPNNIFLKMFMENEKQAKLNCRFGPIEDETQQFEVMDHLMDVYKECFASNAMEMLRDQPYVLNVWLPEAVVYSLRRVRKISEDKALHILDRGPHLTKAENQQRHDDLIATAKNLTEEELEWNRQRHLRLQQESNFQWPI